MRKPDSACEGVGCSARDAYHAEAFDSEAVNELTNVVGPIEQAASGREIRAAEPRSLGNDEMNGDRRLKGIVREPGGWRPVE